MRGWLRSHLTYANVIATLALFLVLSGGTAVALTGSNTVFSDDIVNDQVYSGDVRNDTLSGGGLAAADLRANSVGQSEVAAEAIANPKLGANAVTARRSLMTASPAPTSTSRPWARSRRPRSGAWEPKPVALVPATRRATWPSPVDPRHSPFPPPRASW